jgi:hypothetical protein
MHSRPYLELEAHGVLRRQAHAGAEDVDDALSLRAQRVDDGGELRHHGRLEQVREGRQHGVEGLVLAALALDLMEEPHIKII